MDTLCKRCPKCDHIIYNRRNKICGYCGAELPEELLFTAVEVAALDKKMKEAEKLHLEKEAEALRKLGQDHLYSSSDDFPTFP
jgi:hypothetical protein